jgi:hypothetical protein
MSQPTAVTPPTAAREPAALRKWLVIALAVAGLAAAAVVEGKRNKRWGTTEEGRAAAAKLGAVPAAFGDWASEEVKIEEKVLKVAEADGHVSRAYKNRKTGAEVTVLMLCGPSGPIGAHTPDVCYAGAGYAMAGDAQKVTVAPPGEPGATYWSARFDKKAPPSALRVCWMWGTDGNWEASENARFGLQSALYKMYVVRSESDGPAARATERDPVREFLTDFLPEVRKALAPPPAGPK